MGQQWEYTTYTFAVRDDGDQRSLPLWQQGLGEILNDFGKAGWELVAVVPVVGDDAGQQLYHFKRLVQQKRRGKKAA